MGLDPQPIRGVQIVRKVNRGAVPGLLRREGPLSRTAVARATRLTLPTCFAIIDELVAAGLARCRETARSGPGRPRAIFGFNPSAAFSLGVDLSSDTFLGVLINLSGEIRETRRDPRPEPPDVDRAIALGERWFGAGRDVQHPACVNVGMGISLAVVIDGILHRGASVHAGELGHTVVDANGLPSAAGGEYAPRPWPAAAPSSAMWQGRSARAGLRPC